MCKLVRKLVCDWPCLCQLYGWGLDNTILSGVISAETVLPSISRFRISLNCVTHQRKESTQKQTDFSLYSPSVKSGSNKRSKYSRISLRNKFIAVQESEGSQPHIQYKLWRQNKTITRIDAKGPWLDLDLNFKKLRIVVILFPLWKEILCQTMHMIIIFLSIPEQDFISF